MAGSIISTETNKKEEQGFIGLLNNNIAVQLSIALTAGAGVPGILMSGFVVDKAVNEPTDKDSLNIFAGMACGLSALTLAGAASTIVFVHRAKKASKNILPVSQREVEIPSVSPNLTQKEPVNNEINFTPKVSPFALVQM